MRRRVFWRGAVASCLIAGFGFRSGKGARLHDWGSCSLGPWLSALKQKGFGMGCGLATRPAKNLVIQIREAKGQNDRLPQLARELVDWIADVLVAVTPVAITAANRRPRPSR
jgi:hypothetical protein